MKRNDLTGKKFGELTVIGYSHSHIQPSGQKRAVWDVICSCGTPKKVSTANLTYGNTTSCGHVREQKRRHPKRGSDFGPAFNKLFNSRKGSAKFRGYDFLLSKDDAKKLFVGECHYCGSVPARTSESFDEKFIFNGIDRVDNTKGYILGNVVSCCYTCNLMKNTFTVEEFLLHIKRIASHASSEIGVE